MTTRRALLLALALAVGCASDGPEPAGDDLHVISPDKADDYYSNAAAEFEVSGVLAVEMTAAEFEDPVVREELALRRVTAFGLYLTAYVTAKFEGIDHDGDGEISEDERFFHNMGYGDFSALVRNQTADDMVVSGDEENGYETTFTIDVAGPRDLTSLIPRAEDAPVSVNELVFDVQMPEGASIDPSDVPRREFRRFDPEDYDGELETIRCTMRPHPTVSNTYPRYNAFITDGLYDITLFYGHDYNESRSDLREAEEAFETLESLGFEAPAPSFDELTADSGPFVRTASANGRVFQLEVRIFHSEMFTTARQAQHDLALNEIVTRDVFFYNGHAGPYFGFYLDEAYAATVNYQEFADAPFQPDRQQLVVAQGCQTYSQYADMLYANREKSELNLDVITTVNYSYGRGTMELLRNLIQLDAEGNHQPVDFYQVIGDLNGEWLNSYRDVFYGVTGISENPQIHPYANLDAMGQQCSDVTDCGDRSGNVCLAAEEAAQPTCGALTLNPDSCPEGSEFRHIASGSSITSGACFAIVPEEPEGREYAYDSSPALEIPDNDPEGVSDTITVDDPVTIHDLRVEVDLSHTYRGDLIVELERAGRRVALSSREGGSQDDLVQTFEVRDFVNQDASGDWTLHVSDNAQIDTGSFNSWRLLVTTR